MKKFIFATLFTTLFASSAMATDIRFATEATYPPFEFISSDNSIQGFDIDLANALCKEIQANCTFTHQEFDSLIPGLKFRRFDALIAALDVTPERLKQVAFTQPYYDNSAIFITNDKQFTDITSLQGKSVGVQNGTTHQKYLTEKHPGIKAVAYSSYQNAIQDLKSGRISAVFGDTAVVNEWLVNDTALLTVGNKVTDDDYFGTGFAIAVRQNNTELLGQLNTALEKIKADGTYQKIYDKWFKK